MINEYVYCPRLFYLEHVESQFANNLETIEGSIGHRRVDEKQEELPPPEELIESDRPVRSRSVMLSSDPHGVIAKMDLVETDGDRVIPVDYKRGSPRKQKDGTLEAWDTDRVQLGVQAIVLRENGYRCDEAIVYYAKTRQRVRFPIDQRLLDETLKAIGKAHQLAKSGSIPGPLADSPKCPRCSLVGICLPEETAACCLRTHGRSPGSARQTFLFDVGTRPRASVEQPAHGDVRRLVPARDDLRPLYLNTQGLSVGKSANVLMVKEKGKVIQKVRIHDICQLNLLGNIQLTTQAIQTLCQHEVPIAYFSMGGWFYGITQGLGVKNIFLRQKQFHWADSRSFCLRLARALVAGKLKNQRTLLQRNHVEPPRTALAQMKCMQEDAEQAESLDQLLGIEGNGARVYFQNLSGMLKTEEEPFGGTDMNGPLKQFDFKGRNRRPPRDPVNALLSLAYSVLAKDLTIVCHAVGFDPYLGFFHQPRYGRASLALDLMEPFRPLIADSAVLSAINTRMVTERDFIRAGGSVALTPNGRKAFFRAYEQRMDTLVTHPLFGYRVNYRRMLEIQARLLARVLTGELVNYPVFTTR
jgi:CRISPR-associated protein Cas1